jgi:hypothetical protein
MPRHPFAARADGVEVRLAAHERALLVHLFHQLDQQLDDGSVPPEDPLAQLVGMGDPLSAPVGPPQDPALARLLPDAHRDDPQLSLEFRRLTELGLRSRKRAAARRSAELLATERSPTLDPDSARTLLRAMNDLRLVLGERLELQDEADAELLHKRLRAGKGPQEWMGAAALYEELTYWLEYLVQAVCELG